MEIFTKEFYGNTVAQWLIALGLIVAAGIAGRILYWISTKIFKPLTQRTRFKIDELLVDLCEEPIVLALVLTGIWHSLKTLSLGEVAHIWIGNAFYVAVVMNIAWMLTRLVDALFQQYLAPLAAKTENELDDVLLPIARKGTRAVIWITAIIVGLDNAGYNVGALLAGLGVGGLALAMAAKDTVANLFGGVTVFLDKPFRIGDRIVVKGFDGTVTEIGIRSTRLKTLDNRIVTMPNADFASAPVENISSEPSRKIVLNLGLTYDTSPESMEDAMATLRQIGADHQDLLEENVIVLFNAFNDSSLNLLMIYFIRKGADIAQAQTVVNLDILKRFNANGLEFAFPTRTIYSKSES